MPRNKYLIFCTDQRVIFNSLVEKVRIAFPKEYIELLLPHHLVSNLSSMLAAGDVAVVINSAPEDAKSFFERIKTTGERFSQANLCTIVFSSKLLGDDLAGYVQHQISSLEANANSRLIKILQDFLEK